MEQADTPHRTRAPGTTRRRIISATEPVARALAGRRWFPLWAVLHHRGRKSGTEYATPLAVVPTRSRDVVLIGLPWGPRTNWARNVVAADGATLTWKGRELSVENPRIIDGAEASTYAKPRFRRVIRRFPAAMLLSRGPVVAPD